MVNIFIHIDKKTLDHKGILILILFCILKYMIIRILFLFQICVTNHFLICYNGTVMVYRFYE